MSLAPRILAAAGLLAVPALLAVGSQALSRPADVPLEERQVVVVDLATTEPTDPGAGGEGTATTEPEPGASPESLVPPSEPPTTAPLQPEPAPAPAPVTPADQGVSGLVEREVLDDDVDDDGGDFDGDAVAPDGED